MKGLVLKTNEKTISGGLDTGITSVLISNKDGHFKLRFESMDDKGVFFTWQIVDLILGDYFSVIYDVIGNVSTPIRIGNGKNTPEDDVLLLESYRKLKQELINEGLIK